MKIPLLPLLDDMLWDFLPVDEALCKPPGSGTLAEVLRVGKANPYQTRHLFP